MNKITEKQTTMLTALYDQIDMIGKVHVDMIPYRAPAELGDIGIANRSSVLSTLIKRKLVERKAYGAGANYKYRITAAGVRHMRESV